ncbi:FtsK/SpoIIIE domain-containing protein [Umezawaea sp. Da 62-37]|uniref:FtsK/SpoIIIE domain-containing protein n=1 Tax=Umezawaea sp. Da 62-37 TaxID=3075927 RepID=UPI0028F6F0A5|nr:FtsK/SpoIIIE domain-containing protein [Umezawaea sp. Da 62-37]WNV90949.1 FtsK/SpoIIIE domain-containing protein [Umezawaea sp. Da 62-37]
MSTPTLIGTPDEPEYPPTTDTPEVSNVVAFPARTDDTITPDTATVSSVVAMVDTTHSTDVEPSPEVLHGELIMVDQPTTGTNSAELWEGFRGRKLRPLVAPWLRSWEEFQDTALWGCKFAAHTVAYHLLRTPLYALRLLARSPRGAGRLLGAVWSWVTDAEGRALRKHTVAENNAAEYLRLSTQRNSRVGTRAGLLGVALVGVLVGWFLLPDPLPVSLRWALWAFVAGGLAALGAAGMPADKPLISRAVVGTEVAKLTNDIVIRALSSLGIAAMNPTRGTAITFPAPIQRDGPGWRAEVDLPFGVTAVDIMERRDRLASGLRRPLGCVWPEPSAEEHAGRLVLWVGNQPMSKTKQPAWPLAKRGQADVFAPLPFGNDQRGRQVAILLMFANILIGAMPRYGKTFALRVLLLALALDPRVEMRIFELKGTGDLSALAKVSHHYASGADDDTISACVDSLREVYKELETRARTISGLSKDICPENKVTPELSSNRKLGLHPLAFSIDECQELFSNSTYGKEAGELATAIIKRGPALGIILILATQRPDKDSLPTGVSANVGIRFCLRVMGQTENDMVLGTSAYKNGIRATTFTQSDKGIGFLVGAADEPQVVRSSYMDGPESDRIADRARALREKAGTVTGHAAGQVMDRAGSENRDTLLDDIAAVVHADESKVWSEAVADRLAVLRPSAYGHLSEVDGKGKATWLSAALKPHKILTDQVWGTDPTTGKGANRRGIKAARVLDVIAERDRSKARD